MALGQLYSLDKFKKYFKTISGWPKKEPHIFERKTQEISQEILDENVGVKCVVLEEVDGLPIVATIIDGVFKVTDGKNDVQELYWNEIENIDLEWAMRRICQDQILIKGWIIGRDILGNYYNFEENKIMLYEAWDLEKKEQIPHDDLENDMFFTELDCVPWLCNLYLSKNIEDYLKLAEQRSTINPSSWQKGILVKQLKKGNKSLVDFRVPNKKFVWR